MSVLNPYDSDFSGAEAQRELGRIEFIPLHIGSQFKVEFVPIILNSYSDNVTTKVGSAMAFGRTDPMRFFEGNERVAAGSFTVLQEDGTRAKAQFDKLKRLMRTQYPVYSEDKGALEVPPLFRVRLLPVGDAAAPLLDEIGFLDGMKFDYADSTSIINTAQVVNGKVAPRYFTVAFNLSIMHREVAGFTPDGNWLRPSNNKFPFEV